MRWSGRVDLIRRRGLYAKIVVGKYEGNRPLATRRRTQDDNTELVFN
jgi:hypothetical protein